MASVILDDTSLARTLWNLDEARFCGARPQEPAVKEALAWVAARQGLPRAYRSVLFAPTDLDFRQQLTVPTADGVGRSRGGGAHIVGEEAVRALSLWGYRTGWDAEGAVHAIHRLFGTGDDPNKQPAGMFCCAPCSVARWRALNAAKPAGWEQAVADGLKVLASQRLQANGRWVWFPFYYTLAALSEIELEEAGQERARIRRAVDSAMARLRGDEQHIRFRRRALEWAMEEA